MEKQLQEKERLATLGTTAAVFAHEIANPLNGMSTALQMANSIIADLPSADTELRECIESASSEIERLALLLNDYRFFARPQHPKLEPTDLGKLLKDVLALHFKQSASREISIHLDIPDQLPIFLLDAGRIKQAVLNLCQNAVDAMPKGGNLVVRAFQAEGNLVIEVSDTGTGISENFE